MGLGLPVTTRTVSLKRAMPEFKNDADIIRQCQKGDDQAYVALVERYQDKAFWISYNMLGNKEDARDVVQEAFVRVFRSISRFDFNMSFYTWLYRIVTNLSIDQLRKLTKRHAVRIDDVGEGPAALSDRASPSDRIEESELKATIRTVLDQLPENYKTVMVLRDIEGLSCKEIASITGTSHPTVRWRLHTARKQFKEKWQRYQKRRSEKAINELQ